MFIFFNVLGVPVAKGRARSAVTKGGKAIHYTPQKTRDYENAVRVESILAMQGKEIIKGPVQLNIVLHMPIPKSWTIKKKNAAITSEIFPTTKPDMDNVLKAISDAMNGIIYEDDSQIVSLSMHKVYSPIPRAEIKVQDYILIGF